jgi:transposase
MAMPVQTLWVGVDVSKAQLDICISADTPVQTIDNTPASINHWLKTLPAGPVGFALEATSTYHLAFALRAHRAGHPVYLIDGYRLSRYRDSIGQRAKTDVSDARLLQRYLRHEHAALRPWVPPEKDYERLQKLLRRRAHVVKARVALQQSLAGLPDLRASATALFRQLQQLENRFTRHILQTLARSDWQADFKRCQAIEGVGPLTAAALTTAFHRGPFKNSDAFIAFLGLDVRVRDSGRSRGKRKLTKKGDPEIRRLLHNAAMSAIKSGRWKVFYQRYLGRGLTTIQALVIVARKLARTAFALMKNQTEYQPDGVPQGCGRT